MSYTCNTQVRIETLQTHSYVETLWMIYIFILLVLACRQTVLLKYRHGVVYLEKGVWLVGVVFYYSNACDCSSSILLPRLALCCWRYLIMSACLSRSSSRSSPSLYKMMITRETDDPVPDETTLHLIRQ